MEGVDQEQREEAEDLAEDLESFQKFHEGSLRERILGLHRYSHDDWEGDVDDEATTKTKKRQRKCEKRMQGEDRRQSRARHKRRPFTGSDDEEGNDVGVGLEGNVLSDFLTDSQYDMLDRQGQETGIGNGSPSVPATNAGAVPYSVLPRSD